MFALLQPELLFGGLMKGKCESPRVSVKHSHQTNFRKKILSGKRTEWVQMSSGEVSRFSADETNENGMPALHSPERRGALHPQHHISILQPSDGMGDLSKTHVQALHLSQDVSTGLPLPLVSDPLCSQ